MPRRNPARLRPQVRTCRACGCTDSRACPGGCHWVAPDLCSACEGKDANEGPPTRNWCTDGVLGVLVEVGVALTVKQVAGRRDMTHQRAQMCLDVLRRRGLAERVGKGLYRVTKAGRAAHAEGRKVRSGPCRAHTGRRRPRADSLQARLWRALRQVKKATVPDLITLAARDTDRDPGSSARHYIRALAAAGYVALLKSREPGTAPTSNGFKRYLLTRDTGPAAPIWNKDKEVLRDPNTGQRIEVHFGKDRPAEEVRP
jgi:hypothetical protein